MWFDYQESGKQTLTLGHYNTLRVSQEYFVASDAFAAEFCLQLLQHLPQLSQLPEHCPPFTLWINWKTAQPTSKATIIFPIKAPIIVGHLVSVLRNEHKAEKCLCCRNDLYKGNCNKLRLAIANFIVFIFYGWSTHLSSIFCYLPGFVCCSIAGLSTDKKDKKSLFSSHCQERRKQV